MTIFLPSDVKLILSTLKDNNYEAYIVGGCVRDSLLNISPKDWDIATNALPEDIIRIFQKTVPTGIKHGTVTVLINDEAYEVTTFRIDGEYSDSRHPDCVIFSDNITEDLSRRDLTINAMAYDENKLIDPFHGRLDLEKNLIRCVGNPSERFKEDALRMLRAIRFSCQLEFTIESVTLKSILENNSLINNISAERIRDELCKILSTIKPSSGMRLLRETKLLQFFLPELGPDMDSEFFEYTLKMLDKSENNLIVRLAALLYNIKDTGHKICSDILKRLRFDNYIIKTVCTLLKESTNIYKIKSSRQLKELINIVGKENIHKLFELEAAAGKYDTYLLKDKIEKIISSGEPLNIGDLDIDGDDLIRLGYTQGKELGTALNKLLQIVLEHPEMNDKHKLINIVIDDFNF